MTMLRGVLSDRDSWSTIGECPIETTMAVVGTTNSMLLVREAYYGTTRFDDFARRLGITRAAVSARLRDLVDVGIFERHPYREPGQRRRDEYLLTERGIDLMPVVWAMFEWGRAHDPNRTRLALLHDGCGERVGVELRCSAGHIVHPAELGIAAPADRGTR